MTSAIAQRFPTAIQWLEDVDSLPGRLPIGPGDDALEAGLEPGELHQLADFGHPRPLAWALDGHVPAEGAGTIETRVEMDDEAVRHHQPIGGVVDFPELQGVVREP